MKIEISVEKSSGDSSGKIWELSVNTPEYVVMRVAREIIQFLLEEVKKEEEERMREEPSDIVKDEFPEQKKGWEE